MKGKLIVGVGEGRVGTAFLGDSVSCLTEEAHIKMMGRIDVWEGVVNCRAAYQDLQWVFFCMGTMH